MSLPHEALAVPEEQRERVRAALIELRRTGAKVTLAAVQKASGVKRQLVSKLLGLHRDGRLSLDAPWTDAPAPAAPAQDGPSGDDELEGLALAVESADSPRLLSEAAGRVAALALRGRLNPAIARVLRDLIQERRRGVAEAREVEAPPDDGMRIARASEGAMKLVRAFDSMVNGWRREWLLLAAAEHLEADVLEFPNEDQGGTPDKDQGSRLARWGLDETCNPVEGAAWPACLGRPQVPPAVRL